jgi:hypothetical protein
VTAPAQERLAQIEYRLRHMFFEHQRQLRPSAAAIDDDRPVGV